VVEQRLLPHGRKQKGTQKGTKEVAWYKIYHPCPPQMPQLTYFLQLVPIIPSSSESMRVRTFMIPSPLNDWIHQLETKFQYMCHLGEISHANYNTIFVVLERKGTDYIQH
jgi:hypothetical protein